MRGAIIGSTLIGGGRNPRETGFAVPPPAGACIVDAMNLLQPWEGLGATNFAGNSIAGNPSAFSATADFLWSSSGLQLPIYNFAVLADSNGNGWPMYSTNQTNTGVVTPGDFSVEQAAAARGVKRFMARCWAPYFGGPPFTWQTGNTATGAIIAGNYPNYSLMWQSLLTNGMNNGVAITDIVIGNEPDFVPGSYAQAGWTTAQWIAFVNNNLGPDLLKWAAKNPAWRNATGMQMPNIHAAEVEQQSTLPSWVTAFQNDPTVLNWITHFTQHQYGSGQPVQAPPAGLQRRLGLTEYYLQGQAFDTSMTTALATANSFYANLIPTSGLGINLYLYWNFIWVQVNDTEGLIGSAGTQLDADWLNPTKTKNAYGFGQISQAAPPASRVIGVSNAPSGVNVCAFLLPPSAGKASIACINNNASSTPITLYVKGVNVSSALPTITDPSNNKAVQGSIGISANAFSTTLTANSITTFVLN